MDGWVPWEQVHRLLQETACQPVLGYTAPDARIMPEMTEGVAAAEEG
jgi:hypothetical protein